MYIGIKIHKIDCDRTYYQTVVFESSIGNLHQTKKKSYKEPGKFFFDALQSFLGRIMNKKNMVVSPYSIYKQNIHPEKSYGITLDWLFLHGENPSTVVSHIPFANENITK